MTYARPGLVPHLFFFGLCVIVFVAAWRATAPAPEEGDAPEPPSPDRERSRRRAAALRAANRGQW